MDHAIQMPLSVTDSICPFRHEPNEPVGTADTILDLLVCGVQTVVERIDHRSKVQLMKHFIWGVTAYVLATAAVIVVPLFVAPGDPQVLLLHPERLRWVMHQRGLTLSGRRLCLLALAHCA